MHQRIHLHRRVSVTVGALLLLIGCIAPSRSVAVSISQAAGHAYMPRWYVLTEEDFPEDVRDHQIVRENIQIVRWTAQYGFTCLGDTNQHTGPEFFMSNDLGFPCIMLHRFMNSPLRTYDFQQADFVVIPAAMPADLDDDAVFRDYFKDAPKIFPRRKEKPHVLMIRWQFPKQIPVIEAAPEEARNFYFLMQQFPAYFFNEFDSWWNARQWKVGPTTHPAMTALRYNIIAAPWLGMTKWTQGSTHFHKPLDVAALKAKKKLPLKGYYQVRTPQREWLHKVCNSQPYCESDDIWAYAPTDHRHFRFIEAYEEAWVAIQVQGDEVTRTAMNDVWCNDGVNLYLAPPEWIVPFFPFTDLIDYRLMTYFTSKHIDQAIRENDEDYLKEFEEQFTVDRTIFMIEATRNISHIFQYMQNPYDAGVRFDTLQDVHKFDDAYTHTVKALLRHFCRHGKISKRRCGNNKFDPVHDGIVGPQFT